MGACEPEPILNTGWFDAPAARGLIMHTKVFGDYPGPEEILDITNCFTEINATQNYAPQIATAAVKVLRSDGTPAAGANVLFGIYNYAEFYPAVPKVADSMGVASLSAGLGTMVVWANDGQNYGFSELRFGRDSVVVIELNRSGSYASDIDIVPPREVVVSREISADQRAANVRRLTQEDSIRRTYVSTFMNETQARKVAADLGLDSDKTSKFLVESRGNHAEIETFLRANPNEMALQLLGVISRKDLHDTPASVLNDHLHGAAQYKDRPFFVEYILNPRIDTELLTPYRSCLSSIDSCGTVDQILSSVNEISLVRDQNPANIAITPLGVHNLRMADEAAIERYTMALLRSKGIAARHEPIAERVQYYNLDTKSWINIAERSAIPKGKLALQYKKSSKNDDPKYYTHFTIAKLENGEYKSIDISSAAAVDMGAGMSISTLFAKPLPLEVGSYRLTSGSRMASGTVLSRVVFFDIEADSQTDVELVMRKDSSEIQVIGSMNPESMYVAESGAEQSILSTTGRGYFVIALVEAKKEPTNHAIRDLVGLKKELEEWGRSIVILFRDQNQYKIFDKGEFSGLPSTVVFGYDSDAKTANMVKSMMEVENMNNLPIFMIADSFGRVVFFSQGYRIGMGEQMMRVINGLKPE